MNEINTARLFADFPEFFKHRDDPRSSLMCFGFECGDGWYDLIYSLCEAVERELQAIPEYAQQSFYVVQVKEKFGGLRFYTTHNGSEEIQSLIIMAEAVSYRTCEECGMPGVLCTTNSDGGYGWVKTLCPICSAESAKYYLYIRPRAPDETP